MWETIKEVLVSGNGIWVIALSAIIIVLIVFLIKKGYIKIHSKHVTLGDRDKERAVIRHQTEFAHGYVMAFRHNVPYIDNYNEFQGKYIMELLYDEIIQWIIFNHIETTNSYIEIKQAVIWNIVLSNASNVNICTEEFKQDVYDGVRALIIKLVAIRNEYL